MSWNSPPASRSGPKLSPPSDGIVASLRPRGWLANAWQRLLQQFPAKNQNRIARGRSFARGGRVRDLWFSPGLATAEVYDSDIHLVSLRVQVYDEREWRRVVEVLLGDLRLVGAMLEGDLPRELVEKLDAAGIHLVPTTEELGGDCDCGDFLLPCEHMAAVHHLLADALDGDPFLLPTLRGSTRDQLLALLRTAWGDPEPFREDREESDEAPPDTDWFAAPRGGVPTMKFDIRPAHTTALGLRALGPPPGEADLGRALTPLYESGAEAALGLIYNDEELQPRRVGFHRLGGRRNLPTAPEPEPEEPDPMEDTDRPLTERLVDLLAELESAKSRALADRLGVEMPDVRNELLELEKLGIVYRTGRTRGTRWWLG